MTLHRHLSGGNHNPSGGSNGGAAYNECQTPILSVPHDVSVLKVVVAVHDGAAATWRPVIGRHGRLELRDFLLDFPQIEGCSHLGCARLERTRVPLPAG